MAHQAGPEAEDHLLTSPGAAALSLLAAHLQVLAIGKGLTLATAESCTGGLVGHSITENPGSSAYYLGGVVSYADSIKIDQLGVSGDLIERYGAVSEHVAVAMAVGIRARFGSDLAISVTGVAGPGGGGEAKPVGSTFVAFSGPHGSDVRRHEWQGDRAGNKRSSAAAALELAIDNVQRSSGAPFGSPT